MTRGSELGVYVHVPFCTTRCDYCDFATWTDRAHLIDDYVDACIEHVRMVALAPATSVFFGGGTPSLLPGPTLARLLAAIPRAPDAEVTVECNPDSVDRAKLHDYAAAGVNRVSFGVQSMRQHVLAALGRTHDPDNVARAVDAARAAGIARVNLDLIYGTPGESVADWEATLDLALALEPEHVSAYGLTVEAGTPLGKAVAAGERAAPDDDDQAEKYEVADDRLTAAGRPWYEISNWALPGEECRHNVLYWEQGDYAAIGCAAHGHTAHPDGTARRFWNLRTPERYVDAVRAGSSPEAGEERLGTAVRVAEALTLGLRTVRGIKLPSSGADHSPVDTWLDELSDAGLLARDGEGPDTRVVLTRPGRLVANDVTARLLAALDATALAPAPAVAIDIRPAVRPGTR
jgi:oxygen-independent coproporphyrinogen-3 oxidase